MPARGCESFSRKTYSPLAEPRKRKEPRNGLTPSGAREDERLRGVTTAYIATLRFSPRWGRLPVAAAAIILTVLTTVPGPSQNSP